MTRVPMAGFNPMPHPDLSKRMPEAYITMGETAENVAARYQISRERQDAFAAASHMKAAAAQDDGRLATEIVAIGDNGHRIDTDGCIRPDTSAEALAGLQPAFLADGSVTAGSSSPLTDGAAAVLVVSGDYVKAHGLKTFAKVRSIAVAGCAPEIRGIGPVAATRKALERARLTVADIDVVELNEAFAAQSIACIDDLGLDVERTNLDGGAIALGHPLGATGARITGKAAQILKRENKQIALASQCIGGGQGIATILEAA